MSDVPASGTFNADDDLTQGEFRQALEDVRNVLAEIAGSGDASGEQALTIATGVVTPAAGRSRFLRIDTQGAAASDDLDTIAQTNVPDQAFVFVSIADNSRVVNVQHNAGGAGQISLSGGLDFQLNRTEQILMLKRNGSSYLEVGRFGREAQHVIGGAGDPAYENSWVAGSFGSSYWKDEGGMVHVIVDASKPSVAVNVSAIFTLPLGYRPTVELVVPVFVSIAGVSEVNWLKPRTNGQIRWERVSAPSTQTVQVHPSTFSFRAAG